MTRASLLTNPYYLAVEGALSDRTASRSGVPFLNHVLEGVQILEALAAGLRAKEAFCLHPILQGDQDLAKALSEGSILTQWPLHPIAIALSMEYRSVANRYLCGAGL